jgi:hypothetical protein
MREWAAAALSGLRWAAVERLFPAPIVSVETLGRFVGQRSAYVAQTSLYGYLKTRMGTKFPQHFESQEFAASIKAAAVLQFISCSGDLTVFAVAEAAADGRLDRADAAALARRCFELSLQAGVAPDDAELVPRDAATAFAARAERTVWASARGEAAFAGSIDDLIRHAPVTEEFKALDRPIVRNSIRFRWRDVRDQLRRRMDAAAVCADWLAHAQR